MNHENIIEAYNAFIRQTKREISIYLKGKFNVERLVEYVEKDPQKRYLIFIFYIVFMDPAVREKKRWRKLGDGWIRIYGKELEEYVGLLPDPEKLPKKIPVLKKKDFINEVKKLRKEGIIGTYSGIIFARQLKSIFSLAYAESYLSRLLDMNDA